MFNLSKKTIKKYFLIIYIFKNKNTIVNIFYLIIRNIYDKIFISILFLTKHMKKYISLIIISFFIIDSVYASNSFLYTKSIRWKIIEDFKEEQFKNIFHNDKNILLKDDLNFFETQNKIESLKNIRLNASLQVSEDTSKINVVSERIASLKETIAELENQIKEVSEEITTLNRDIKTTIDTINTKKENIKKLNSEVQSTKKVLLDYIAHIYKKWNIMYDENNNVDSLKTVILNEWNISTILDDLNFSSVLEFTWQSILQEYRNLLKDLFVEKLALEEKNNSLKNIRLQTIEKEKDLQTKKEFREKILNFSEEQFKTFSQDLEQSKNFENNITLKIIQNKIKLKNQKRLLLNKHNCDYIDENMLFNNDVYKFYNNQNTSSWEIINEGEQNNCIDLNKILTAEFKLNPINKNTTNSLSWPVYPARGLSAYFRDPEYKKVVWASHDGIDIKASQWTDILAPADWYIIYLKSPLDSSYAYVALKHTSWIVTIYWHVSEVLYNKYDFIPSWTVFARVWWELWTPWAWVMTSWAHLHFEVFQDKQIVDPLNYLDLTVLWEDNIPKNDKYIYKFFEDYKNKFWIDYIWDLKNNLWVFSLNWETETERQKDLLSRYASNDFSNWDMWVEESMDANIDPSFAMCIWLAETSLWNKTKTQYNIWNVWNTDSWETRLFYSPREWISAMVNTLNNKFLWKYQYLSELSRYWNSYWTIYASSQDNWHNNNIKCLQALKWKHVADNFKFRLSN